MYTYVDGTSSSKDEDEESDGGEKHDVYEGPKDAENVDGKRERENTSTRTYDSATEMGLVELRFHGRQSATPGVS